MDSGASDTGSDSDADADVDTDADADVDTDSVSDCLQPEHTASCEQGWCRVEPGCFVLGSPVTEPCRGAYTENQVQVTLTRPFLIGRHEVIQAEWEAVGFENPATDVDPQKPLTWINWFEALAYANALSAAQGLEPCYDLSDCQGTIGSGCPEGDFYAYGCLSAQGEDEPLTEIYRCEGEVHLYPNWYECPGYRLATVAEWEYAARAGTTTATYNGDILVAIGDYCETEPVLEPIAWYCANSGGMLHQAEGKQPNALGLFDMLGNAFEWTDYVYTGHSLEWNEGQDGPLIDPLGAGTEEDTRRDIRGGDYNAVACRTRAADNLGLPGAARLVGSGLRLVRTVFEEKSSGK